MPKFRWTKYLVKRSHAGHVDSVDVDVDTGPPQQGHDRHPVALLDALLEDHLVGEANPALARILPSKNTCSARHGSCLCCPVLGSFCRLWILKCLSFRLSQWLHDHLIAFFTICVFQSLRRRSAVPRATFAALVGGLGLVLSARWGLWRGLRASAARRGCLDLVPVVHGGSKPLIDGGRPKTSRPPFCPSGHGRSCCSCTFYLTPLSSSCLHPFLFTLSLLHQDPSRQAAARARKS